MRWFTGIFLLFLTAGFVPLVMAPSAPAEALSAGAVLAWMQPRGGGHAWGLDLAKALDTGSVSDEALRSAILSSLTIADMQRSVAGMRVALSKLGAPYIWGAAGPDAFDCSGLVQWSLAAAGVQAPRTAEQQYRWAQPIPVTALERGDLVFFHTTYPSSEWVTHVGIYAGNRKMLHAPTGGDWVKIESFDAPYWKDHWAGAGRIPA